MSDKGRMKNANDIANRLGKAEIADALGVTVDAVSASLRRGGRFPAAWFPVVRRMCATAAIDCPEVAFKWKAPVATSAPDEEAAQ